MKKIEKYSMGVGDRFNHQAKAQLSAVMDAAQKGINVVPVWNKSYREHSIISSTPQSARDQADAAVKDMGWNNSYYVDADHVGLKTVDLFLESSDFFTLDVADFIGKETSGEKISNFVKRNSKYSGTLEIPGIERSFDITGEFLLEFASRYLLAAEEAGNIFRHIKEKKDVSEVIIEVSMDETETPQTPIEMFFILSALHEQQIPLQTIAPKFSGRFNKGVDYVGNTAQFKKEFENDLAVIAFAVKEFGLYDNLKLSVHSGSDKFSIYPSINNSIKKYNTGLHIKTAGTTWLEELIGLAEAGGSGLETVKEIYYKSLDKYDILTGPYATVIDIDKTALPSADTVKGWTADQYVNALRHDRFCSEFNLNFRQLLHTGYKIAADMGQKYIDALLEHEESIAANVKVNILERHLKPVFG